MKQEIIMHKGKPCIKAKVHMLPMSRKNSSWSNIWKEQNFRVHFDHSKKTRYDDRLGNYPQHLYITTDETGNKGDVQIYLGVANFYGRTRICTSNNPPKSNWKKIIATTDPKLKANVSRKHDADNCKVVESLPQPSQSFIEAYCKAGGIDEVLVEVEVIFGEYKGIKGTVDNLHPIGVNPKLKSDNTIIIHPVEEKMYSREKMQAKCIAFADLCVYKSIPRESIRIEFDKWIEENL